MIGEAPSTLGATPSRLGSAAFKRAAITSKLRGKVIPSLCSKIA